jgi:hypothetical protein
MLTVMLYFREHDEQDTSGTCFVAFLYVVGERRKTYGDSSDELSRRKLHTCPHTRQTYPCRLQWRQAHNSGAKAKAGWSQVAILSTETDPQQAQYTHIDQEGRT